MPTLSNEEHQVILNMCARIHELTPQGTRLLTSAYLRASKISQDVEVAAADIFTSKLIQTDTGRVVIVTHNDTGHGVMLVAKDGSTQVRFLKALSIDRVEDDVCAMLESAADAIADPDNLHMIEVFNVPGGAQFTISTNPQNGLSSAIIPNGDLDVFQLWNTERYEDRTSTYSIQYWSPLTPARQTPPTRTPYEPQEV